VSYLDSVTGDMSAVPNGHDAAGGDADSVTVDDTLPQTSEDSQTKKNDETDAAKAGELRDEVVVIQDTGFNISIVTPGVEPFDLPVYCN